MVDRPPTLVTLSEAVKFDGRFPGDKKDWTKWDQGVEKLVRQNKAAAKLVEYEIWNEPDRSANFKGSQADFFSIWVHTGRLIRAIDADAALVGPSISKHDHPWTQEFLKIGKEYDVPTTIVCWHEDSRKPDLPGHINGVGEAFWQDGTDRARIRILPSNGMDRQYNPADPILFLAPLQQAYRDSSFAASTSALRSNCTTCSPGRMRRARSIMPTPHTPTSSPTADTPRSFQLQDRRRFGNLGRPHPHRPPAPGAQPRPRRHHQPTPGQAPANQLGPLTLLLKNVSGTTAHVTYSTISNSGEQAFTPTAAMENNLPIVHGELRLPLTEMATGQVCVMELKISGTVDDHSGYDSAISVRFKLS